MKRVSVHADDFGLSEGTNAAIAELFELGAIQSTSVMVNAEAFDGAMDRYFEHGSSWSVGLHVNLTQGTPSGPAAGLEKVLDHNGSLTGRKSLWDACRRRDVSVAALTEEIRSQLDRCEARGFRPTHLDTHQHAHAIPEVCEAMWQVARDRGLLVRVLRLSASVGSLGRRLKSTGLNWTARRGEKRAHVNVKPGYELFSIFQAGGMPDGGRYQSYIENCGSSLIELMVHPACVDDRHQELTLISGTSAADYEVLGSEAWRGFLADPGPDISFMPTHELLTHIIS